MPHPTDTIPQTTQDFAQTKALLYDLVVLNKFTKVLETGTDVGDSARIFSTALTLTQGKLVTADIKPPIDNWPAKWPHQNITFLQGDSRQLQLGEPIDLLFLDAHTESVSTYDIVSNELQHLGVWVRAGGKIVVDDYFHNQFGSDIRKALEEFTRHHFLPWTIYPHGHGLAVIEVIIDLPQIALPKKAGP